MTHYDVLGVAATAPADEVRRAYLALARQHHPDRSGGDAARMQRVNEAWAVLGDPARRAAYDAEVGVARAAPPEPDVERERLGVDDLADLAADLADDRPLNSATAAPRWLPLVPAATFAGSVGALGAGFLLGLEPVLGLAVALFLLSCLLFLALPFMALAASRRAGR